MEDHIFGKNGETLSLKQVAALPLLIYFPHHFCK